MNTLNVYNLLDGKTLCNIFASLIVNKINQLSPNSKTEISVINVRSFFIVKGITNSGIAINPSEILQEFLKPYGDEKSNSVRVIDVILYNTEVKNDYLNISKSYDKKLDLELKENFNFLNTFIPENLYFNYKVDHELNSIFFDCDKGYDEIITKNIIKKHKEFKIIKSDFSQETYISDRLYGISNTSEILYHLLLENITYHLFTLGISKKLNFSLKSNLKYDEIDSINCFFKILNNNHIVKTDWLESMVLDVFPFSVKELNDYFDIKSYNPIGHLLGTEKPIWENLSCSKDILLI